MSSRPLQVLQSLELGTVVAAQVPGQAAGCPQGFQRSHDRYRTRSKQGDRAKALAVENVHHVEYPVPPAGCQLVDKEIDRPCPVGHPDDRGPRRHPDRHLDSCLPEFLLHALLLIELVRMPSRAPLVPQQDPEHLVETLMRVFLQVSAHDFNEFRICLPLRPDRTSRRPDANDLIGPGMANAVSGSGSGGEERPPARSEEHTSELQSLMRRSYAVFCLKKKKTKRKKEEIYKVQGYKRITKQ